MTRIESLEKDLKQTKQTMGNAIVKLVKKVKKMEKDLQKDESEVFETPKQGKSSRETYISPQGLEAAETLAEALSQIKTKRRNVKTGVRRRLDAEDVSTGFEDVSTGFEDVSTGFEDVSTGFTDIKSASEKVSSGGEHVSASQREGKAVLEETPRPKEYKKQIEKSRLSFGRNKQAYKKGLQKKPESAKSGTEEDVEAYMEERVDEPSFESVSKEFIHKDQHLQIVKMAGLSRTGKRSVHCLTMEAAHIYMLTEVKYPLPPRVCKAILEKKLLGR
ncbi:hypothetical protein Tco_1354077 [Tanacetum coccineum]